MLEKRRALEREGEKGNREIGTLSKLGIVRIRSRLSEGAEEIISRIHTHCITTRLSLVVKL